MFFRFLKGAAWYIYMLKKILKNYVLGRCGVYSFLFALLGIFIYVSGIIFSFWNKNISDILFDVSVPLVLISVALFVFDVFVLRNLLIARKEIRVDSIAGKSVSVGITAYNDENCIGDAVSDFIKEPNVKRVVVVDNNSTDKTGEKANEAGATVVIERKQGYGHACMRALKEASEIGDIIVLVEGDKTFSAGDLKKLLPYLENCDMVIGTRTTKELNDPDSQMDWLMVLGNIFVAKLLQIRFWGIRFTDMGCTYRVMRKESYEKIKDRLNVGGMHFLPHMMIQSIKSGLKVIEVPITFKKRAGKSKGVGSKKLMAVFVGIKMIFLILFS